VASDSSEIADTLRLQGVKLEGLVASKTIRMPSVAAEDFGTLPRLQVAEGDDPSADLVILEELGAGGMGVVYAARHRSLDREVALKRLYPEAGDKALAALLHEARITSRLDHPNIVPLHFVGLDGDGDLIVVMKLVRGQAWLDRPNEDDLPAQLEVLSKVALALEFAHSRGIIHRDVKPDNVMLGDFGEVYLVDWGIAWDQERDPPISGIVGTPAYMAPEMAGASHVDARTDVYLLGANLHWALTGLPRHGGDDTLETLKAMVRSEPFAFGDDVPAELAELCNRACHVDPDMRPTSAAAFREELHHYLERRTAFAMLHAADEHSAAFERALDETIPEERLRRLFDRTCFGYAQLLDAWPDLADARLGHDRAVRRMLRRELDDGRSSAARALLARLLETNAADEASVQELEQADARDRDVLETRARDGDVATGSSARFKFALTFMIAIWLLTTVVVVTGGSDAFSSKALTTASVVTTALAAIALWIFRGRLRDSVFNRLIARAFIATTLGVTLHRVFDLIRGTPADLTMATDLIILATSLPLLTPVLHSAIPLAAASFASAGAMLVWPHHTTPIFATHISLLQTVVVVEWWWRSRSAANAAEAQEPGPRAVQPGGEAALPRPVDAD
jgi:eukaryotic-like serine/threonine-protein kinase